jgi:hypothetical protein
LDEHQGIAPCIPVWKTGVYLSTPMLEKMESRAGVAPAYAALQAATGLLGQRDFQDDWRQAKNHRAIHDNSVNFNLMLKRNL